jgi:hypothetical protein
LHPAGSCIYLTDGETEKCPKSQCPTAQWWHWGTSKTHTLTREKSTRTWGLDLGELSLRPDTGAACKTQ